VESVFARVCKSAICELYAQHRGGRYHRKRPFSSASEGRRPRHVGDAPILGILGRMLVVLDAAGPLSAFNELPVLIVFHSTFSLFSELYLNQELTLVGNIRLSVGQSMLDNRKSLAILYLDNQDRY
jgi:hypothetical protein